MGYNQAKIEMKKSIVMVFSIICLLFVSTNVANAQEWTKIGDGLYLVSYGNTAVIEDDIHQCTLNLKVEKSDRKDSNGRPLYDFFCGNKYTKGIAKTGLKSAITAGLTAAGAYIGGPSGAAAGATIAQYANSIASNFYDDVCDYFGE